MMGEPISVKERMPERLEGENVSRDVLCFDTYWETWEKGWYDFEREEWREDGDQCPMKVSHWMPLPPAPGQQCHYEGCSQPGTTMVCGRDYLGEPGHPEPAMYCEAHVKAVYNEGSPAYIESCPNCGCLFGSG
jgi:hypothetical protein